MSRVKLVWAVVLTITAGVASCSDEQDPRSSVSPGASQPAPTPTKQYDLQCPAGVGTGGQGPVDRVSGTFPEHRSVEEAVRAAFAGEGAPVAEFRELPERAPTGQRQVEWRDSAGRRQVRLYLNQVRTDDGTQRFEVDVRVECQSARAAWKEAN